MAGLTIASIDSSDTTLKKHGGPAVRLTALGAATAVALPVAVAVIVALLQAVLPFVTGMLDDRYRRGVEGAKIAAAERAAASEWMKAALAIEDAAERGKAVRFFAKAGLLPGMDPSLKDIQNDQVPKMPATPGGPVAPVPEAGKVPTTVGR